MRYDTAEVLTNGQDPDYWPDQHHAPDCKCLLCEWLPIARSRLEAAVHAARSAGEAHGAVKEKKALLERLYSDLNFHIIAKKCYRSGTWDAGVHDTVEMVQNVIVRQLEALQGEKGSHE